MHPVTHEWAWSGLLRRRHPTGSGRHRLPGRRAGARDRLALAGDLPLRERDHEGRLGRPLAVGRRLRGPRSTHRERIRGRPGRWDDQRRRPGVVPQPGPRRPDRRGGRSHAVPPGNRRHPHPARRGDRQLRVAAHGERTHGDALVLWRPRGVSDRRRGPRPDDRRVLRLAGPLPEGRRVGRHRPRVLPGRPGGHRVDRHVVSQRGRRDAVRLRHGHPRTDRRQRSRPGGDPAGQRRRTGRLGGADHAGSGHRCGTGRCGNGFGRRDGVGSGSSSPPPTSRGPTACSAARSGSPRSGRTSRWSPKA